MRIIARKETKMAAVDDPELSELLDKQAIAELLYGFLDECESLLQG